MHKTLVILTIALAATPLLAGALGGTMTRTMEPNGGGSAAGPGALDEPQAQAEPYAVDHGVFAGILGCAVIVQPVNPADVCRRVTDTLGVTDDNHVTSFSFFLPAGTTAMAIRMEGDEGLAGPVQLLQRWYEPATQIPDLKGAPPLDVVWDFPPETAPPFVSEDRTVKFVVTATGDFLDPPNAVLEHHFEVYIVTFHNGMPVPEGFQAGPAS